MNDVVAGQCFRSVVALVRPAQELNYSIVGYVGVVMGNTHHSCVATPHTLYA